MLKAIDPRDEFLLAQLDRIQMQMEKAQREISSGRRVNAASDAPDEVSTILSLRASNLPGSATRTSAPRRRQTISGRPFATSTPCRM